MKIDNIQLDGLRWVRDMQGMLANVKQTLESRINLNEYSENVRPVTLNWSTVMRSCLLVGLSDPAPRNKNRGNR